MPEKVAYAFNVHSASFLPQVIGDDGQAREFHAADMNRVLDFDVRVPSPPDGSLRHCSSTDAGAGFPYRHFCMRGTFLFYFDVTTVEDGGPGGETHYHNPPLGVIPVDRTVVEFPPGGRRVFQEHARTDAAKGYEFVIRHEPPASAAQQENGAATKRPDFFLVADSLSQREEWASAIRVRAELIKRITTLRPGRAGEGTGRPAGDAGDAGRARRPSSSTDGKDGKSASLSAASMLDGKVGGGGGHVRSPSGTHHAAAAAAAGGGRGRMMHFGIDDGKPTNSLTSIGEDTQKLMRDPLLQQFTHSRFRDVDWINDYFAQHSEFESEGMCSQLEATQLSVKRGLRGAVLEQYKYFVEASREMTTMGREVASLTSLVEGQYAAIERMKGINFADAFADPVLMEEEEGYYSSSDEEGGEDDDDVVDVHRGGGEDDDLDDDSSVSSTSSLEDETGSTKAARRRERQQQQQFMSTRGRRQDQAVGPEDENAAIEIPDWLTDATEEIASFINYCRYTEATDLILKAKSEVTDILNLHDKLTDRKLTRKQHTSMQRIVMEVEKLISLMGDRLAETLRRKNEALKQACKRERADPSYSSSVTILMSPICLEDDATALQLLVKLGRSKDAALAYSTRRSLLLSESMSERPIASSGSVTSDVEIYSLQLSQSFFTSLAQAVEGFLDLYLGGDSRGSISSPADPEEMSLSSAANKNVPAGALASIVLWCDSELSKFAHTFGGSRMLGKLSLTPAMLTSVGSGEGGSVGGDSSASSSKRDGSSIPELRKKLRAAEEAGDYALAGSLRRKLTKEEESQRKSSRRSSNDDSRSSSKRSSTSPPPPEKDERQQSVEIAAKCVEHAFSCASERLDSIGLPLTPRLAECLRPRLKGCEAEIASIMGSKWHHVVAEWHIPKETESRSPRTRSRRNRSKRSSSSATSSVTNGSRS